MTKHRKILEGVSEGPLHAESCVQPNKCCVVYSPQKMYHIANFDDKADANLFVYARNQWPAICDLIEAVELYKLTQDKAEDYKSLQEYKKHTDESINLIYEALDKLNEEKT